MSVAAPEVRLVDVDAANWRNVVAVAARPDQERFVAPVAYYLCLAHYGGAWHPLGIEAGGSIVGHVMWAVDEDEGSVWLGGLVIDAASQGRGIGHAAVRACIERFAGEGQAQLALSYQPDNTVAGDLYASFGFVETGEMEDNEIVARLSIA